MTLVTETLLSVLQTILYINMIYDRPVLTFLGGVLIYLSNALRTEAQRKAHCTGLPVQIDKESRKTTTRVFC